MNDPKGDSDFDARLAAARAKRAARAGEGERRRESGASAGYKMVAEMVSGVVVGLAVGWGVDEAFGTAPWGLLVMLFLGVAAGFYNVVRTGLRMTPKTKDDE